MTDFDFDGIASFEKPDGIDVFKMKLESESKVEYYNIVKPNSLLGHLAMKMKGM